MDAKSTCLKILRCVNKLRLASVMCDVSVIVGGTVVPAHKTLLAATSDYFLSKIGSEKNNLLFEISDISSSEFVQVLDFLYTGQINVTRKTLPTFKNIAQQLQIPLLMDACLHFEQSTLTRNRTKSSGQRHRSQMPLCLPLRAELRKAAEVTNKQASLPDSRDTMDMSASLENTSLGPNASSMTKEMATLEKFEDIPAGSPNCIAKPVSVQISDTVETTQTVMVDIHSESECSAPLEEMEDAASESVNIEIGPLPNDPFVSPSFGEPSSSEVAISTNPTVNQNNTVSGDSKEASDTSSKQRKGLKKVRKREYRYHCSHCTAKYTSLNTLRAHFKRSHPDKMSQCQFCPRLFIQEEQCERHMDWCRIGSAVDGRFNCPECSYKAVKRSHVVEHYRSQHTTRYSCNICLITFPSGTQYHEHLLQIHDADLKVFNRKVLQCSSCNFKTIRYFTFQSHMSMHHKSSYVCKFCSKVFKNKTIWLRHQTMLHEKPIIYECGECRFQSRYKSTLYAHQYRAHQLVPSHEQKIYQCRHCDYTHITPADIRKHEKYCKSDAKPYLCSYCPRAFQQQTALTIHERLHTGLRPFKCSLCPYTSRSRPTLKSHYKHIHSAAKPYVCENCGFQTKSQSNLSAHKKRCQQQTLGEHSELGLVTQTSVELEQSIIADCVAETIQVAPPTEPTQETETQDQNTVEESCVYWLG